MMLRRLLDAELSGRGVASGRMAELPPALFDEQDRVVRTSLIYAQDLARCFQTYREKLEAFKAQGPSPLISASMDEREAFDTLTEILSVVQGKIRGGNGGELGSTKEEKEFCRCFVAANGWECILRFLEQIGLSHFLGPARANDYIARHLCDINILSLTVLKELCYSVPDLGHALGENDDLICLLLQSLRIPGFFEFVSVFCEELLIMRESSAFDLRKVPNLQELVESMNACQLVCYTRIISSVTIDPIERNISQAGKALSSFALLDQRRRTAVGDTLGTDLVKLNHEHIINNSGELLPRLVQLLQNHSSNSYERSLWLSQRNTYWRRQTTGILIPSVVPHALLSDVDSASIYPPSGASIPVVDDLEEKKTTSSRTFLSALFAYVRGLRLSGIFRAVKRMLRAAWDIITRRRFMTSNASDEYQPQEEIPDGEIETDPDEEAEESEDVVDGVQPEGNLILDVEQDEEYVMPLHFWVNREHRELWLLMQRIEIAAALGTLCSGPSKRLVQDQIARFGIVAALTQRFDSLPWDPSFKPSLLPSSNRVHGQSCECDPHGALKAQMLRLVHNFCDREYENKPNKLLLLSSDELSALPWDYKTLKAGLRPQFGWEPICVSFPPKLARPAGISDGDWRSLEEADAIRRMGNLGLPGVETTQHGFAWRVAAVLISGVHVSADTSLNFWIYAALEAFLRGSPVNIKMMVCSWGVLRALTEALCKVDVDLGAVKLGAETEAEADPMRKAGYFQTIFDLLGEMIKNNTEALAWLCGMECPVLGEPIEPAPFNRIATLAMNHLVDGNVFLRAVGLTLHRAPQSAPLDVARNWMDDNRPILLRGLWSVVRLDEISQENLCCLNTSVVLLTFARWKNEIVELVESVPRVNLLEQPTAFTTQLFGFADLSPQEQFRKLLWFWRCYYSCRNSDRMSIEYSSGIPFKEVELTVRELCERDPVTGMSILTKDKKVHVPYVGNPMAVTCSLDLVPWDRL